MSEKKKGNHAGFGVISGAVKISFSYFALSIGFVHGLNSILQLFLTNDLKKLLKNL